MKSFHIIEKPQSISWDTIHETLWNAHAQNRQRGVIMSFPSLSGELLREKVENGNGAIWVAICDDIVVGTAAYTIQKSKYWFHNGQYFYNCLDCVLPKYSGLGIYRSLSSIREEIRKQTGHKLVVLETHERNDNVISLQIKNGFQKVVYKKCSDHNNVVMAKWEEGTCPFSRFQIKSHYLWSYMKVQFRCILRK